MNEEMKWLFGKFLFAVVIIVCASAFLSGSISVKERGEYNLYLTKYAVMSFSGTSEKLEARLTEDSFSLDIPIRKIRTEAEKLVCLTPFSPFYYISENLRVILK